MSKTHKREKSRTEKQMITGLLQCETKKGVWSLGDPRMVPNQGREMMAVEHDEDSESPYSREVREEKARVPLSRAPPLCQDLCSQELGGF